MKERDYYIGLDCGTSSVGFAVTDTDYRILKFNGKAMWGSHVFEEANTAKARRMIRCARRRLERRKQRTALLQELFAEEVYKVDPSFFIRMNDSKYLEEDKHEPGKDIIFNDEDFKDKDYFKKYPTVYHLRKALMNDSVTDPRLLYLGINHILKHRGHFLFPGETLSSVQNVSAILESITAASEGALGSEISFTSQEAIQDALRSKSNQEKKDMLDSSVLMDDRKKFAQIVKIILGYKVKPMQLFDNDEYAELPAIEFKKLSFEDEDMPKLEDGLTEDEFSLVLNLKGLFDWALLASIMQGELSISYAKVKLFEKNRSDLKTLKHVIKTYAPGKYRSFFHAKDEGSFSSYIGKNHDSHKSKEFRLKRTKIDVFYKEVKKILADAPKEDKDVAYIFEAIEEDSFMPLLSSYRNSVIPYQVNKSELESILRNAEKNFPFLSEKDDDGLMVSEKVMSILTYRIPYFVGPLGNNPNAKNKWLERNEGGRIRPWNIEKKVNFEASAEKFIERMTNKCTYCKTEDVLPKHSLSYSKYMVLNDLNNIRINGDKLSVERKQFVFNNLFKLKKMVTKRQLIEFVIINGWYAKSDVSVDSITGIDTDFKSSMGTYIDFKQWIENGRLKADDVDLIVKWITIFSEGGGILKNRIKEKYGDILSDSDIESISKLRYAGWGRFSHKFLYDIQAVNKETGELMSIMRMLWNTQLNLMELLSNDYEFQDQIDKPKTIGKLDYNIVDDLYVSPAVKRQIWQTLRIVDELRGIMKCNPKKVFIEVSRSEKEKKRTTSRKADLLDKFKKAQKSGLGYDIELRELIESLESKDESQISRQDKLYLYFSQCGKSMYSGQPIILEDLYNTNIYDVDHIYPYSQSNDDSLKNRVLVLKNENTRKGNSYPIDGNIRNKMSPFWKVLFDKGFIPREKYDRLTRVAPLEEADLKNFIARQLVETSQSVKASASILKSYFGEGTKIVYSKASAVSQFRDENGFIKCRSLNHLHHAKDAFLNIVAGNVLDTKYTSDFWMHADGDGYNNLSKPFAFSVNGAWRSGKDGTITDIRKTMSRNNILFTRQPVERKGKLFDLQIVPRGSKKGVLPAKSSDPVLANKLVGIEDPSEVLEEWTGKYGGYNSLATSHFAVVKNAENNKHFVSFVPISIIDANKLSSKETLTSYCTDVLKMQDVEVVQPKLLMNTMLEIDGYRLSITGKSGGGVSMTVSNCIPLYVTGSSEKTLKKIESYLKKKNEFKDLAVDEIHDNLCNESLDALFDELVEKSDEGVFAKRPGSQSSLLKSQRESFYSLGLESKCELISELMKYYGMDNGQANLTLIGGTKACGTLTKSTRQNLDKTSVSIIHQSITGLFEEIKKIEV